MAELTKMFRSFADVKTQDELDLQIPKLKNDKATVIALDPDPKVVDYIKTVVPKRVAAMRGWKQEEGSDNMLSLTNDLRNLSMPDSKIEACADAIAEKYRDTAEEKGAQLVFCDRSVPKAEKETEKEADDETVAEIEDSGIYLKLIEALKEKGIPEKDIAFIQKYWNEGKQS